jgi:hypothetical protein
VPLHRPCKASRASRSLGQFSLTEFDLDQRVVCLLEYDLNKYLLAEPGALECEPLKAAGREASARVASCGPTLDRQQELLLVSNRLAAALGGGVKPGVLTLVLYLRPS